MDELPPLATYKVIKIYHVLARGKKEAIKQVAEERQDEHLTVQFAVLETPQGFWSSVWKHIVG